LVGIQKRILQATSRRTGADESPLVLDTSES
jgi:hypothetical protein